jgi:hypothetical protein
MGTQFWWFYDVLILSIACGMIYAAAAKGFNRTLLRMVGFLAALAVGITASKPLSGYVYNMLCHESVTQTLTEVCEELPLYENAAQLINRGSIEDAPDEADSVQLEKTGEAAGEGEETEAWFVVSVGTVVQQAVTVRLSPHTNRELSEVFLQNPDVLQAFLSNWTQEDYQGAASVLEENYLHPAYQPLVRMGVFLLLETVVLIIFGIISSMAGNLEEQMHIRRGNHLLAIPVGLVEAACVLIMLTVAVKLLICLTDSQMILFNEATVERSKLFRLLYDALFRGIQQG